MSPGRMLTRRSSWLKRVLPPSANQRKKSSRGSRRMSVAPRVTRIVAAPGSFDSISLNASAPSPRCDTLARNAAPPGAFAHCVTE